MNRRHLLSLLASSALFTCRPLTFANEANRQDRLSDKTGYVTDPRFLQHHIAPGHPESPDRLKFIQRAMRDSVLIEQVALIKLKADSQQWLNTVHTPAHIAAIKQDVAAHAIASAGVAAALAAIDAVMKQQVDNAFSASRPPGHHALNTGSEEGFCYYNHIAIAARYAQQHYDLKKILIVDWDYHHGNATEAMFYDDPTVLFFSTHDQFAYPGTGDPMRQGVGKGLGYNINVHLPCGTGDEDIIDVFQQQLVPAVDRFSPDLVLISAGFDSRRDDPLGCFTVSDAGFVKLTALVKRLANQHCDGRLVSILEGGYNLHGNASAVVAHVGALMNRVC